MKLKQLYCKYSNIIPYAVFGVLTTIINIVVYYIMAHIFKLNIMGSTIIAWIIAVLFAYATNRRWVFHSEAHGLSSIAKEICSFFICRLATGVVDWGCMFIFVDVLYFNDVFVKVLANIIVIILNYIFSKKIFS